MFAFLLFIAVAFAGAAVEPVTPSLGSDGCYHISTAGELYGFSSLVNNSGKNSACAKLDADIVVNSKVLDANGNKNSGNFDTWNSMRNYSGTFDGQGHTISGLVNGSSGLFESLANGAKIMNIGIVDSYFGRGTGTAAFANNTSGNVSFEKCFNAATVAGNSQVSGFVAIVGNGTVTFVESYNNGFINGEHSYGVGGFVAVTRWGSNIQISNCYNSGNIDGGGRVAGMVGIVGNGSTVSVENSYNIGTILSNNDTPQALIAENGGTVNVEHSYFLQGQTSNYGTEQTAENFNNGTVTNALNEYNREHNIEVTWVQTGDRPNLTECVDSQCSVIISEDKRVVVLDAEGVENLSFPENLTADSLIFKRDFSIGVYSTIVVPFDIELSQIDGAEFYEFAGVGQNTTTGVTETLWYTMNPETDVIEAGVPHMIKPLQKNLVFHGRVEFKSTGTMAAMVGNWSFKGVYNIKQWLDGDSELGYIYGYAANDKGSVQAGDFVKAAAKASVRPLRAYLLYDKPVSAPASARPAQVMKRPEFNQELLGDYTEVVDEAAIKNVGSMPVTLLAANPNQTVTLTWTPGECVDVSAYTATGKNKVLSFEGHSFYSSVKKTIYSDQIANSKNTLSSSEKELCPIAGVTLATVNNKQVATLDGTSGNQIVVPYNFTADSVVFNRDFTQDVAATVMFPFETTVANVEGATFNKFGGVVELAEAGKGLAVWVEMNSTESIKANVPYVIDPSATRLTFKSSVTFAKSAPGSVLIDDWSYNAGYETKVFEGDEIGRAYGFAAEDKGEIKAGTFVKAASGAKVKPMRGYILYNKTSQPASRPKGNSQVMFAPAGVSTSYILGSRATVKDVNLTWNASKCEDVSKYNNSNIELSWDFLLHFVKGTVHTLNLSGGDFYADETIFANNSSIEYGETKLNSSVTQLCPVAGVSMQEKSNKSIATLNATDADKVIIPPTFSSDSVEFNRTFTAGVTSTVTLPFTVAVSKVVGAEFYTFDGVAYDEEKEVWYAKAVKVTSGNINANIPYIVKPTATKIKFKGKVTYASSFGCANGACKQSYDEDWDFVSTYDKKVFAGEEIGTAFGFAATTKEVNGKQVAAGNFVKAASGASVRPLRAYLLYKHAPSASRPKANGVSFAPAANGVAELPSKIEVRFFDSEAKIEAEEIEEPASAEEPADTVEVADEQETADSVAEESKTAEEPKTAEEKVSKDAEEKTTSVGRMDTRMGEYKVDSWYDVRGRKVNKKPATKGSYYNKYNRVIAK